MTEELLKRGNSILNELKVMRAFNCAFNSIFTNEIIAHNWNGDVDTSKKFSVDYGDELHTIIKNYMDKKIKELEEELESL